MEKKMNKYAGYQGYVRSLSQEDLIDETARLFTMRDTKGAIQTHKSLIRTNAKIGKCLIELVERHVKSKEKDE